MNGEEILLKAIDDTINSYANCLTHYARWMDENHTDCHRLPITHKRHYDHEFIQYLIDTHAYSPATIKLYTAALAFVHSCTMNEVHNNRPTVRAEDTTHSRSYTEEKYRTSCSTVLSTVLWLWPTLCRSAASPNCAAMKRNRSVRLTFGSMERSITVICLAIPIV